MNFIMIGLLLREALDRLCVRLNMYLLLVPKYFFIPLLPVQIRSTRFRLSSPLFEKHSF